MAHTTRILPHSGTMFQVFLLSSNLAGGLILLTGLEQMTITLWVVQLPALAFYMCGLFLTILSWRQGSDVARWTAFSFHGLAVLLSPNSMVVAKAGLPAEILISAFSFGGLAALIWITFAFPDGTMSSHGRSLLMTGWLSLTMVLLLRLDWAWFGVGVSLIVALLDQRQRYLNTTHRQVRQQMRWMMTGLTLCIGGSVLFVLLTLTSQLLPEQLRPLPVLIAAPFAAAALLALPVCLFIAILRYRLWDEAEVINPVENEIPTASDNREVDSLTAREIEVLQLVAQGCSNQQIADQLVISLNTVKRHISNIYGKLAVTRRTEAVHQARELGLLPK